MKDYLSLPRTSIIRGQTQTHECCGSVLQENEMSTIAGVADCNIHGTRRLNLHGAAIFAESVKLKVPIKSVLELPLF